MTWDDNSFPKADNPDDVGWVIFYWRITKCDSCTSNYQLESRQFDHLPATATYKEAKDLLAKYVAQWEAKDPTIKGMTYFLAKVDTIAKISDNTGELIIG